MRADRRHLEVTAVQRQGELLTSVVCALPELRAASTVAAYVSRPDEPSTVDLRAALRRRGVRVLLPVVRPDLDLDWAFDDSGDVRPGTVVDVPEPVGEVLGPQAVSQADVVLVPALAVDRSGTRLGQGGGSYDRALARARPDALVVALLHPGELVDGRLPSEPHDRPVHVVVTAEGVTRLVRNPV